MVKIASSVPGVFLVGSAGGKMRPWCGSCHKFLKSETAPHDCTPMTVHRGSRKSSFGGRRRIRLTPKTKAALTEIFRLAAREQVFKGNLSSLAHAKSDKELLKKAKHFQKKASAANSALVEKKVQKLVKRFL